MSALFGSLTWCYSNTHILLHVWRTQLVYHCEELTLLVRRDAYAYVKVHVNVYVHAYVYAYVIMCMCILMYVHVRSQVPRGSLCPRQK